MQRQLNEMKTCLCWYMTELVRCATSSNQHKKMAHAQLHTWTLLRRTRAEEKGEILQMFKNAHRHWKELITSCGWSLRLCSCISCVCTDSVNESPILIRLAPFVSDVTLL